jgi:hypothetical protein
MVLRLPDHGNTRPIERGIIRKSGWRRKAVRTKTGVNLLIILVEV